MSEDHAMKRAISESSYRREQERRIHHIKLELQAGPGLGFPGIFWKHSRVDCRLIECRHRFLLTQGWQGSPGDRVLTVLATVSSGAQHKTLVG